MLRYIPLSALHDGDQWIAERFRINNITSVSLEKIGEQTDPLVEPRVFAGAFADQSKVYDVKGASYRGLPYAGQEVLLLADTVSLIKTFLDDDFSFEAVETEVGRSNILHFATHASFVSNDPDESFILFGDSDFLTVKQILDQRLDLSSINLVVLSACETGLGGISRDGKQILGLGYQFQSGGAKSVIASLWQVNDGTTQILMNDFYQQLAQGFTKREAIQKAQVAMINSDLTVSDALSRRPEVLDIATGESFVFSTGKISHPYYWAPFILIGNGL